MTRLLRGDFVYRSAPPLLLEKTEGCRLHTPGRSYIDCQATSGAAILGYDRSLLAGVSDLPGPIAKPQTGESHLRMRFADRLEGLIAAATGRRGHIGLELGGAQAIELALKVALSRHKRITLFTIEGAYHGRSLFTSHLSASRRYTLGTHLGMPVVRLPNPCLLAEQEGIGIEEATDICLRRIEAGLTDERLGLHDPSGAVPVLIYEAIQNVAGMLDLPARYLQRLETMVRDEGGLSIVDEIFSGLYRFGPLFCHAAKGLSPDMVVFSKGLTNGVAPLSAIWVAEDTGLAEDFRPGTHSCTYLNYELGLALADRVLDRLDRLDMARVSGIGAALLGQVRAALPPGLLRSSFAQGTVMRLDFATQSLTRSLSQRLMEDGPVGVLHATTGLARTSLIFHPPYVISDAELAEAAQLIGGAMQAAA